MLADGSWGTERPFSSQLWLLLGSTRPVGASHLCGQQWLNLVISKGGEKGMKVGGDMLVQESERVNVAKYLLYSRGLFYDPTSPSPN